MEHTRPPNYFEIKYLFDDTKNIQNLSFFIDEIAFKVLHQLEFNTFFLPKIQSISSSFIVFG
jgi:hypothetical protein